MLQLTIKAKPYFLPINADVTPAKFKLKFSSYSFCHNQRVYHIFNCHFNAHYTSVNYFPIQPLLMNFMHKCTVHVLYLKVLMIQFVDFVLCLSFGRNTYKSNLFKIYTPEMHFKWYVLSSCILYFYIHIQSFL